MSSRILLVEPNEVECTFITSELIKKDFEVQFAKDGLRAYNLAKNVTYDLIIMEVELPNLDGFTLCKKLRSEEINTPIIFLSNLISEINAVIGLELGAQDYIRKPFSTSELIVRINNLISESKKSYKRKIEVGSLIINTEQRKIFCKGRQKNLSKKEFDLIKLLANSPGKVFSRDELLKEVWGKDEVDCTRTIDAHIGFLRKKIEENPKRPRLLKTVRNFGYCLATS